MDDFIKGLLIFQANGEEDIAAEHDVIYAGGPASIMDTDNLEDLGWHYDEHLETFYYYV